MGVSTWSLGGWLRLGPLLNGFGFQGHQLGAPLIAAGCPEAEWKVQEVLDFLADSVSHWGRQVDVIVVTDPYSIEHDGRKGLGRLTTRALLLIGAIGWGNEEFDLVDLPIGDSDRAFVSFVVMVSSPLAALCRFRVHYCFLCVWVCWCMD